ncbi:achaete-scute homolog 1-like [Apostichopus japonicus]|uniref:achaete-scute homolog 1-like n=1 Tax=Stichopus japonicus TaxID=307972 RepID=UPI003AB69FB7
MTTHILHTSMLQNQPFSFSAFKPCGNGNSIVTSLHDGSVTKSTSPQVVVAKRLKEVNGSRKLSGTTYMRVKRRSHFGQLGGYLPPPAPAAVARRNERERNRVKLVNLGFASLRNQLPDGVKNKKMSKVETLRSAVDYIKHLQELLDDNDAVNAVFSHGSQMTPSPSATSTSSSPVRSPIGSASSEPLSPEEADLANFPEWFLLANC